MRILITGANSFIGTNFRRFSKYREIEEISVRNLSSEKTDFHSFDVVLHLAAITHNDNKVSEAEYFRVNRDLCIKVANQAKKSGIKHFIFLSTVNVYGRLKPSSLSLNENSPCYPENPYGKSKYEAEIGLKILESPDFVVSIIRTPIVYGPNVKANMLQMIRIVKRNFLLPFAGINNRRHFTYVENLVGFIDRIIEKWIPGTFLVMDDGETSTTQLVKYLSEGFNKKKLFYKLPEIIVKSGYLLLPEIFDSLFGSFSLDNTLTKETLNYNPPFSTREGLQRMIYFYINQKVMS